MRVLWVTNVTFPEAIGLISQKTVLKGSGGWLTSLADALIVSDEIELHVASISTLVKELLTIKGEKIVYHILPAGKGDDGYNVQYEALYREVFRSVEPDVVHIHGTEYPHSLAALRACGTQYTVVSIQGLASVIARYNSGGISKWEALRNISFHDLVRGGIIRQQREMCKNGTYEEQLLREVKYVIGRTSFDRAHLWALNPDAKYFHCGEILRKEFYGSREWNYDNCVTHSVFMSQAAFPIRGLHIVIKSLIIVSQHFPDFQIRIAGRDVTFSSGSFIDRFRITGYGKILRKLIRRYKLEEHITFTGQLTAEEMVNEYLNCNIFLCPSSIENSPNSLAEAQILGVPCVASYVGGIPDMMKGYEGQLYRFDDAEMLAYKICEIFENASNNQLFPIKGRNKKIDDRTNCINKTISIYREIVRDGKEK